MSPDKITPLKPSPPTIEDFKRWAEGHLELSLIEQVNEFSAEFNLTPEEKTNLEKELGIKPPEPKKPVPPRPRGEVFKAFLDYANRNPGLQLGQAVGYFAYAAKLTSVELMYLTEDVAKLRLQREEEKRREEERERREKEEKKKREEEEKKKREEEEKMRKEEEKKKKPTVKPELIIKRTPYPKWWNDSLNATINLTAPGSAILATVSGKLRLYVATIVITVTAATQIYITFGNAGSSGPISLGDTDQPMGIVIAMGNSPAPCGSGALSISATDPYGDNALIGGFATCFAEEA